MRVSAEPRIVADRYRLDERIGSGGMGVVWRAFDTRLNRIVAVKQLVLGPELSTADAEEGRARAMREGRIAARLEHPHAINVFDVAMGPDLEEDEQAQPWLVMEYLPSRSLADMLADGPLPPIQVAGIGAQVADALAAAHQAGIVHRDVKPGNVLIGDNGTVKITDFGIARASWDVTVTRTGVLTGTPAYFAPEVARGEEPGPASDVFSFGSTLYTAVEGVPPFGNEDNALALLRSVAEGEVRPPQNAGPLGTLLMQLLRYDPAQRPVMAVTRDMLARIVKQDDEIPTPSALPAAADGAPIAVAPDSVRPLVREQPERRAWWQRGRVLVGALVVLLLGTGALILALTLGEPNSPSTAAREPTSASASVTTSTLASTEPVTTIPEPTTPPAPPAPTAEPAPPAEPGPADFQQAVQTYYGLLPDQLDEAYSYLGPDVQDQAGGRSGYENFWSRYSEVEAQDVRADGTTVTLTIVYTNPDGSTFTEPYVLEMGTAEDGRILILSSRYGTG